MGISSPSKVHSPMSLNMQRRLRMKCPSCGHWNKFLVNKIFLERASPEPKVQLFVPMYEPLEIVKCRKCGKIIAEPKELIRVKRGIT